MQKLKLLTLFLILPIIGICQGISTKVLENAIEVTNKDSLAVYCFYGYQVAEMRRISIERDSYIVQANNCDTSLKLAMIKTRLVVDDNIKLKNTNEQLTKDINKCSSKLSRARKNTIVKIVGGALFGIIVWELVN